LKLPKDGFDGDPPAFPLARPSKSVQALWDDLWSTPQAAAWSSMGSGTARVVARYAKMVLAAEKANAPSTLISEVRQLEHQLGLTPRSMQALQWVIDDREIVTGGGAATQQPGGVTHLDDYRELYGETDTGSG
jgi:hypothetical protein